MGIKEGALALADELEAFEDGDCEECIAYGQPECKGHLSCAEIIARYSARKVREAVESDAEDVTTVSAYDLLPEDERKAIAWVREHGGLEEVEKRIMPEGMEWLVDAWPRLEDGKPVRFLDDFERYGNESCVSVVTMYADGSFALNFRAYSRGGRVNRPAPKVLDADGVEIGIGDKLYDTDTGCARIVRAINANGTVEFEGYEDRGWFVWKLTHRAPVIAADGEPLEVGQTVWRDDGEMLEVLYLRPDGLVDCCGEIERPERLTHQRPEPLDSWERIEEDASLAPCDYIKKRGRKTDLYAYEEMPIDLVRRCRALAERGER